MPQRARSDNYAFKQLQKQQNLFIRKFRQTRDFVFGWLESSEQSRFDGESGAHDSYEITSSSGEYRRGDWSVEQVDVFGGETQERDRSSSGKFKTILKI